MGTLHEEFWLSEGAGRTRKERRSGAYSYYLPTLLNSLDFSLDQDVVNDVASAERAIAQLNEHATTLQSSEGIARLLLRTEAVSSSHIEGLVIGTRRLLEAEMNFAEKGLFKYDRAAASIVGNIHAMETSIREAQAQQRISVDTILDIHRSLCKGTSREQYGGAVRDRQNWVGGNSYNPLDADYVPPSPRHIPTLLEDLAEYCNRTDLSPIVQAAIAHAQFESIHPFIDGNGRTGRALIHVILRKRGLAPRLVPPVSLVMATHSKSYVEGLTAFRFVDEAGSDASERLNEWISFFAGACNTSCDEAAAFEESAREMEQAWASSLGGVRKGSAVGDLLKELPGMPLFSVATASKAIGKSFSSTSLAVNRCLDAGIIRPTRNKKRNRIFEVPEVIDEFNLFERRLASPAHDTAIAPPVRPVPENLAKERKRRGNRESH